MGMLNLMGHKLADNEARTANMTWQNAARQNATSTFVSLLCFRLLHD